jgi:hypothetical protein
MGQNRSTASAAWHELEAQCLQDEQIAYEIVCQVLLLYQSVSTRATEVGVTPKTIQRKMRQFVQFGIPGLVPATGHRIDDKRQISSISSNHPSWGTHHETHL